MSQQESIEQKLTRMIDTFRTEFENLTAEEKKKEQMISSLREPCQIHILSSPNNSYHLLIKTHLDSLDDKSIFLCPLQHDSFLDKLEQFASNSLWEHVNLPEIKEFTTSSFKESVENAVVTFGKHVNNMPKMVSDDARIGSQSLHNQKLATWDLYGNLSDIDFDKYAIDRVLGYRADFKRDKTEKTAQIREFIPDQNAGLGTYFYPPVLFGDFKPTIKQRIQQQEYAVLEEYVVAKNFQNHALVITKGGLIGIESTDKESVEKIFSAIMSVAVVSGIPLQSLSSSDLAEVTFDNKTHKITGSSWHGTSQRLDLFHFRLKQPPAHLNARTQISIGDLENVLRTAENILANDEHVNLLKLLLSSYTQLSNGDNSQSFITSWIIVERHIYGLWMQKLLSARVSKRIRDDLDRWDLYRVLEILHLDKVIPDDEYVELRSLQGLRNDVIHEGHEITEKLAAKCFGLAMNIVKKRTNLTTQVQTKNVYI